MQKVGLGSYHDLMTAPVERWAANRALMQDGSFSFVRDQRLFCGGLKESFERGQYQKVPMILGMTRCESSKGVSPDDVWDESRYKREVEKILGDDCPAFLKIDSNDGEPWALHYKNIFGGEWQLTENIYAGEQMTKYQRGIYLYRFDQNTPRPNGDFYGPQHSDDLYYLFGSFEAAPFAWTETDRIIADEFQKYVVDFVKTGDPSQVGHEWPDEMSGKLMYFGRNGSTCSIDGQQNPARIQFLKKFRFGSGDTVER